MKNSKKRTGATSVINPDALWMHYAILGGVTVTLLAAIAVSWNGLMWVGDQQNLPATLWWLTPVMVDVPLVVLTFARGALAKRGFRTPGILVGIFALTIYSSAANLAHSVSLTGLPTADPTAPGVVLGASTNALAPWLILSMTEVLWLVATKAKPAKPPTATPVVKAVAPASSVVAPVNVTDRVPHADVDPRWVVPARTSA